MAGKVMDVVDAVQEFSEALGVDRPQAREMSEHLMDMLPRMRVGQRTTLQIAANPGGPDFGLNIARTVRGYRILNLPKPK